MNGALFLLPFALILTIGLSQDSYAAESIVGINYFDVTNPDGSHTWSSHHEYVLDDGIYVPYIQNGLSVSSAIGDVTLNADGSYTWNGKFTDRIVGKYADIANLNSWTYPNTLNDDIPDLSFANGEFHSNKIKAGIGDMDYRYVFKNGQWKTELVVTNLSSLTTKVFGFDQIINLNSDSIRFGGVTRNLDSFDGVTFDKTFLDNNKGKVLDLLNGVNFDFDLGYENLYSITIHDTGANSSQLVFDYRTSAILLPNETLVIDPTFTYVYADDQVYVWTAASTGTSCGAGSTTDTTAYQLQLAISSASNVCIVAGFQWDTSSIPSSSTVTDTSLRYDVDSTTTMSNCNWNSVTTDITVGSATALWTDINDGTTFVSNDSGCTTAAADKILDLGTDADAALQGRLATDQLFGLGQTFYDIVRDAGSYHTSNWIATGASTRELQVTYTPAPDAITDLTYTNLASSSLDLVWSVPGLNTGNVTNYMVNSTTPWSSSTNFLGNTTSLFYNVTGLTWGTPYSFSASVLTESGYNFTGNVLNITTASPLYTGVAPTSLTVNDGNHSVNTILNLEWVANLMQSINGFRIFFETPIGNGFTTLTSNTTTTTTYYNDTGLTPGVFYNYKVAAMNSSGISENSTAFARTPHKLPDSVTDLAITPNALLQFDAAWTAPTLYGTLNGYQINYTTPAGDPVTIYTSTNPGVTATISGLNPTVEYSFRVSANTYHGTNTTLGNIENATASSEIAVGDLTFDAGTNPDTDPIWYENYVVDSTTNDVQVRYDSGLTVDCTITERISGNVNTFTGLSGTASPDGYVYHNFTVTNAGNDILDWDCYKQTDSTVNGQYSLTQGDAASGVGGFGNVPLFQQMGNFTAGLYGTEGNFAGIDLITLFIVIVSMLGFNRQNPALGVGVMAIMLGAAWYFELIPWTSGVLGGIAIVVVLAIGQGTKKD